MSEAATSKFAEVEDPDELATQARATFAKSFEMHQDAVSRIDSLKTDLENVQAEKAGFNPLKWAKNQAAAMSERSSIKEQIDQTVNAKANVERTTDLAAHAVKDRAADFGAQADPAAKEGLETSRANLAEARTEADTAAGVRERVAALKKAVEDCEDKVSSAAMAGGAALSGNAGHKANAARKVAIAAEAMAEVDEKMAAVFGDAGPDVGSVDAQTAAYSGLADVSGAPDESALSGLADEPEQAEDRVVGLKEFVEELDDHSKARLQEAQDKLSEATATHEAARDSAIGAACDAHPELAAAVSDADRVLAGDFSPTPRQPGFDNPDMAA